MQITLGRYYHANSLLHNLDPRLKIALSLSLMLAIFFLQNLVTLAAYGVFIIVLWCLAKLPLTFFCDSMQQIVYISALIFIVNLLVGRGETLLFEWYFIHIYAENMYLAFVMLLRIVYLVLTTAIFMTYTTSTLVIAFAIEDLLTPLKRFNFPAHETAMMMSIALRFVPTIADETETIIKAQTARGANFDTGTLWQKARSMLVVLVPLFVSAINRAIDLATAMEARCYRGAVGRTRLQQFVLTRTDYLFAAFVIVFMALLLLVQILI